MARLKKNENDLFRAWYKGKQFYGKTEAEAKAKRDEYKYECEHGIEQIIPKTVYEFSSDWLPVAKASVKKNTYNQYASIIDILNSVVGDKLVSAVTPMDIKTVWKQYVGKSQSYIDKARFLYGSFFRAAKENGYTRTNPMETDSAKPHHGSSGTHRALTAREISLIENFPHRCQAGAMFMLKAGLRRGELLALRKSAISDGRIHVTEAVSFDSNTPVTGKPKNDTSVRSVPLFDVLKPFYRDAVDYIFPSASGDVCSETAFRRAWESYLSDLSAHVNGCPKRWWHLTKEWKQSHPKEYQHYLNLKKRDPDRAEEFRLQGWEEISFRPHDLRHTFVSTCRDNAIDIHICMNWCGHASEKMILEIYDHVSEDREKKAIDILNSTERAPSVTITRKQRYKLRKKFVLKVAG